MGREGDYVLPGLPGGAYVISFAEDELIDGQDLHPDDYVRQYWEGVPEFGEARLMLAGAGAVVEGVDAALIRGEEVWPDCELASACEWTLVNEEEEKGGPGNGDPTASTPNQPLPATTPSRGHVKPKLRCRKGFRKVTKSGHARCVKIPKRKHHPRHRKARHR